MRVPDSGLNVFGEQVRQPTLEIRVIVKFPDAVLDILASTTRGEMRLGELHTRLTALGWQLAPLPAFEHVVCSSGFSTRVNPLFRAHIAENIVYL